MFGGLPGSKQKIGQSFPRGTTMMFINVAAPYGWTRVSGNDDALLRIVASSTPGTGCTNGFVATFNSQTATGNFTITTAQLPTLSATHVFENFSSGSSSGAASVEATGAGENYSTSMSTSGSSSKGAVSRTPAMKGVAISTRGGSRLGTSGAAHGA